MTISPTTASADPAAQATGISMQDFLKILTSQLSNQDPLKPLDNQEFLAQVAQFSALEQNRQLNLKIDQLLSVQSAVQSIGLLGKSVDVQSAAGPVAGQVTELSFAAGAPQFTVKTSAGNLLPGLTFNQLVKVR
jgi:flagellar basal-body rod modification protein FlgD